MKVRVRITSSRIHGQHEVKADARQSDACSIESLLLVHRRIMPFARPGDESNVGAKSVLLCGWSGRLGYLACVARWIGTRDIALLNIPAHVGPATRVT
jgi:hypothetical protein